MITLKNIASEPIVFLTATLGRSFGLSPYNYTSNVSAENPLASGDTTSLTQIIIEGGFVGGQTYPLDVQVVLQSGKTFTYEQYVQIT